MRSNCLFDCSVIRSKKCVWVKWRIEPVPCGKLQVVRQSEKGNGVVFTLAIILTCFFSGPVNAQSIGIGGTYSKSAVNVAQVGSNASPHLLLQDLGTGNFMRFSQNGQSNTVDLFGNSSLQSLQYRIGTQTFLSINAGNTLGINTTTPFSTLHINSPVASALLLNGGNNAYLAWSENKLHRGYIGSFYGDAADFDFGTTSNNTMGDLLFATNATPRLIVKSNGNVGIGISNPNERLVLNNGLAIDRGALFDNNDTILKDYALNVGSHAGIGVYRNSLIGAENFNFNFFTDNSIRWRLLGNMLTNSTFDADGVTVAGTTRADAVVIENTTTLPAFINGMFTVGNHNADVETFTVPFGTSFTTPPVVSLTVIQETVDGVTDKFAVSLISVSTTGFTAKLGRIDAERPGNGWGQNMKVSWLAIPVTP